jgi:hypothetical protein
LKESGVGVFKEGKAVDLTHNFADVRALIAMLISFLPQLSPDTSPTQTGIPYSQIFMAFFEKSLVLSHCI